MTLSLAVQHEAPTSDDACILFSKKAPSTLACTIRRRTPRGAVLQFASTFAVPSQFILETGPARARQQCVEVNRSRTAIEVEFAQATVASPAKLSRDTVLKTLHARRLRGR